jgi:hypothetical protein
MRGFIMERLHRSLGDSSQRREGASGQQGESISNILKLTKEATVETTLENVTGTIGAAGGAEVTANALRELMAKRRGAAPEAPIAGPSDRVLETPNIASEGWDDDLDKKFKNATALFAHTRIIMRKNIEQRLQENPTPTSIELNMGVYKQELFPHFIDAAPLMYKKGYETWSSGTRVSSESFKLPLALDSETDRQEGLSAGEPQAVPEGMLEAVLRGTPNVTLEGENKDNYRTHQIDGRFTLDKATIEKLEEIGVKVEVMDEGDEEYTRIFFEADEVTTLRAVKATCDQIADILPDKGQPAPPKMTEKAIAFRDPNSRSRDTNVAAPMTAPGAIDIPGRPARETAREASSPESSLPSTSSVEMDDL